MGFSYVLWESSLRADWVGGQAQYDLFVRLAQSALKYLPPHFNEVTERTQSNTEQVSRALRAANAR